VGVNAAAVRVNSATTVYAAEVRTASTSGVGTMGVAGAQATRIKVAITAKIMNFTFIGPLLIFYPASNILQGSAYFGNNGCVVLFSDP
jgi:hypothetical protein